MAKKKKEKVRSLDDLRRIQKTAERQLRETKDQVEQGELSEELVKEEEDYIKSIDDLRKRIQKLEDKGSK
jgi:hypothetical protein